MATHSSRSPSGYARWSVCTASPEAIKQFSMTKDFEPEKDDESSAEGTFAHGALALCLDLLVDPMSLSGEHFYCEEIDERRVVDVEMAEYLSVCYERILDFLTPGSQIWVEQKFDLNNVLPGEKGTADATILELLPNGEYTLHVFDLKYGRGIVVGAEQNAQVMLYALGALDNVVDNEQKSKLTNIVLHILQPRLNNLCSWEIKRPDIEQFRLTANKRHAMTFNEELRKFVPGEHCRFCPKKIRCEPLKTSVFSKIIEDPNSDLSFDSFHNPATMTDDELAEIWPVLDMISAWTKNVKEYMNEQASRGKKFGDLKMIAGSKGKRTWRDAESEEIPLFFEKAGLSDDQMYTKSVITPAVAETAIGRKNINKGGLLDEFKSLYKQTDAKPSLAKADDPRPTYLIATDDEFDDDF